MSVPAKDGCRFATLPVYGYASRLVRADDSEARRLYEIKGLRECSFAVPALPTDHLDVLVVNGKRFVHLPEGTP